MPNLIMQTASGGAAGILGGIAPFLLIFLIFYILVILPQNRRIKEHKAKVEGLVRGDTVVTSGGLIGKVTKVADNEITIELADGVRVKAVRHMIADVRGKPEPANDRDGKK